MGTEYREVESAIWIAHEVDDGPHGFSHKLVVYGPGRVEVARSKDHSYRDVATLVMNGFTYIAVTEYWEGTEGMQPNTVGRIQWADFFFSGPDL